MYAVKQVAYRGADGSLVSSLQEVTPISNLVTAEELAKKTGGHVVRVIKPKRRIRKNRKNQDWMQPK